MAPRVYCTLGCDPKMCEIAVHRFHGVDKFIAPPPPTETTTVATVLDNRTVTSRAQTFSKQKTRGN